MSTKEKFYSITEIVSTVYCEQKVVFDKTIGDRRPDEVRKRAEEGTKAHLAFEEEGYAVQRTSDGRCFVATAVYGYDAEETRVLRQWRDDVLLRAPAGRLLVKFYYAVSPPLAMVVTRSRRLSAASRFVIDMIVRRVSGR